MYLWIYFSFMQNALPFMILFSVHVIPMCLVRLPFVWRGKINSEDCSVDLSEDNICFPLFYDS